MNFNETLTALSEIPELQYQGYYWISSSKGPKKFDSIEKIKTYEKYGRPTNPFILEGNFFCSTSQTSISVRHVDNRYLVNKFNLLELDDEQKVEKQYLAQKDLSSELILFTEIWLAQRDENCENMEVLTKKAIVFTGFREMQNES